jgi:hypothetical protein
VERLLVSRLVRTQGDIVDFKGVYIEVKGYILNQGYSGYPNLSAVARARPTVKYGSDTT